MLVPSEEFSLETYFQYSASMVNAWEGFFSYTEDWTLNHVGSQLLLLTGAGLAREFDGVLVAVEFWPQEWFINIHLQ
jgi:hypothetical protein